MEVYSEKNAHHVVAVQNEIGESPLWVPEESRLYWTDTENSTVTCWSPYGCQLIQYRLELPVTSILRRRGGGWILITKRGLAFWDQISNICSLIVNPIEGKPHLAFNDGVIDPAGRLLAGTMNIEDVTLPDGSIYSLDGNLKLRKLDDSLATANGMAFSPDGETLYVSEQWNSRILAYDYRPATGEVSGRRVFTEVNPEQGYPDGIVVDSEGFLWNGRWLGHQIVRYAPDGKVDRRYEMPEETNTCAGFGGRDMMDLYIATAWYGKNEEARKNEPCAGDLYRIRTDVKGVSEPRFAG